MSHLELARTGDRARARGSRGDMWGLLHGALGHYLAIRQRLEDDRGLNLMDLMLQPADKESQGKTLVDTAG